MQCVINRSEHWEVRILWTYTTGFFILKLRKQFWSTTWFMNHLMLHYKWFTDGYWKFIFMFYFQILVKMAKTPGWSQYVCSSYPCNHKHACATDFIHVAKNYIAVLDLHIPILLPLSESNNRVDPSVDNQHSKDWWESNKGARDIMRMRKPSLHFCDL